MSYSSSDGFLSESGSDGGYESADTLYSETEECQIDEDLITPKLRIPCPRQHRPDGMKCYQNECLKVTKVISSSEDVSAYGNISVVSGDHGSFIVKWNRYRYYEDIDDIKKELRFQRIAWTSGLAPKVLQVYEQNYKDGGYVYMFMPDLVAMGYKTISELYGKFKNGRPNGFKNIPKHVLKDIASALFRLHRLGIAHKDLHPGNVFYNPGTHDVKFIDFGLSEMYPTYKDAYNHEIFNFSWGTHSLKNKIPKNWSDIKWYERS